jgi:RsiW-degrading membrane proteinase PrsW (M82 family)
MTCAQCGAALPPGAAFCGQCGARVVIAPPEPAHAVVPVPAPSSMIGAVMTAAATDRRVRYGLLGGVGCLAVFLGCVALAILILTAPSLAALLVSSIAAVLPVPLYAFMILWLDRFEKEPAWLLFGAFFWGAVVAVIISFALNTAIGIAFALTLGPQWAQVLTPPLVAPVVEETSKGLAVFLIFRFMRHEFNNVTDGIIYGGLVGLGFAMTENVLYFGRAFAGGGLVGVSALFLVRSVFMGFAHALWTAATGAGLGVARETRNPTLKVLAPAAGFGLAMLLHFLWNGTAVVSGLTIRVHPVVQLFVVLPFLSFIFLSPGILAVLVLVYFEWKKESKVITTELGPEVGASVVRPEELALLAGTRLARTRRYWQVLSSHGPAAWLALRQLHDALVELAVRKSQTARGEAIEAHLRRAESEDAIRERIATLRARLAALGAPTA